MKSMKESLEEIECYDVEQRRPDEIEDRTEPGEVKKQDSSKKGEILCSKERSLKMTCTGCSNLFWDSPLPDLETNWEARKDWKLTKTKGELI